MVLPSKCYNTFSWTLVYEYSQITQLNKLESWFLFVTTKKIHNFQTDTIARDTIFDFILANDSWKTKL